MTPELPSFAAGATDPPADPAARQPTVSPPIVLEPSVGQVAARGMIWATIASAVAKVVGFAQLICLAHFLRVEEFGLLTMATTVSAFASVPMRLGLEEILVQRFQRFHLWAGPAFWISLTAGLGTMLLLFALAPMAAWFYGDWQLAGLIAVLGLAVPFASSIAVPTSKLGAEMQFRACSTVAILQIFVQAGVGIPLAAAGAGAMSVAIGGLASAAATAAYAWYRAGVGPLGGPRIRRWRYFLQDAGLLQGMRWSMAIASNVDFVVVGRFAGAGPLGVYSYSYNQSLQAMRLVAGNASSVLFPSLSRFGDDAPRKYAAFCRGLRLVLPLLVPFCLLQAALADPAFRLLFKPEYWPGVPLFQILSVGTVGVGAVTLSYSFLMSLRRNGLTFANAAGSAGIYCVLVPASYAIGGVTGVAWGATATALLSLWLAHWLAARAIDQPTGPALQLYSVPSLLGVLSCLPPWAIVTFAMPATDHAPLARLLVGGVAFFACYPPLLRLLSPETCAELAARLPLPALVKRALD